MNKLLTAILTTLKNITCKLKICCGCESKCNEDNGNREIKSI